jgi:hypothetical protein
MASTLSASFDLLEFPLDADGVLPGCTNEWGVFDMNGNVWKHTANGDDTTIRGGARSTVPIPAPINAGTSQQTGPIRTRVPLLPVAIRLSLGRPPRGLLGLPPKLGCPLRALALDPALQTPRETANP